MKLGLEQFVGHKRRTGWLLYYLVSVFVGGIVSGRNLISNKSEVGNAFFLGFSKPRLILIFAFGLLVSLFGVLIIKTWLNDSFNQRINHWIQNFTTKRWGYLLILYLSLFIFIFIWVLFRAISTSENPVYLAYIERVEPIIWWMLALCIETGLFIRFYQFGITFESCEKQKIADFLATLFLYLVLVFFILVTQVGITPDKYQWRGPGTPILAWNVCASVLLSIVLVQTSGFIIRKMRQSGRLISTNLSTLDLGYFIFLWVITFFLWKAEPLHPNYFNPGQPPPNYEFYPYSDASKYDKSAYRLLIGNGLEANVSRPLLSAFLALGHWLLGNTYDSIVNWQLSFYAVFPAFLYLLAKAIYNRTAGLMIASIAIIREITALKLSDKIYVSNAKMIMSDFPMMVGILIVIYLISYWLDNKERSDGWLLIAGGLIGLTMLIRLQAVVLLLVIFVFIVIKRFPQFPSILRSCSLLIFGSLLVVLPWLTRNYFVSGAFNFTDFSNPSQGGLITKRYQQSVNDPLLEYDSTLDFIRDNPKEVVHFISAHFFHNQINTLLVLPSFTEIGENINNIQDTQDHWKNTLKYLENYFSSANYIESLPYWPNWVGGVSTQSLLPMGINLILVILGITIAWRRHRLAGIFPLFVFYAHVLVISFFRISGWRFLMPVDWIGYFYYGIGLLQVLTWIHTYLTNNQSKDAPWNVGGFLHIRKQLPGKLWGITGLIFFFISASIPLLEAIIPQKYTPGSLNAILEDGMGQFLEDGFDLNNFLYQDNSVVYQGLALYPRFDRAGKGHSNSQWESHLKRDFSRLGFQLMTANNNIIHVVLPIENSPDIFPNGSDVVVLACQNEYFILANTVIVTNNSGQWVIHSSTPNWDCH